MGISMYKIKKWTKMLCGNSVHHVNQTVGLVFSKDEVRGYYNNLTEKVSRFGLPGNQIPKSYVDSGEEIFFAIEIFQYGLGAYDLFLIEKSSDNLNRAIACAEWAVENQMEHGGWKTFSHKTPEHPYSSMAQGEGVSLLLRVYQATKNDKYLEAAQRAVDYMIKPVEDDGTALYRDSDIIFKEFACEPIVLNGWIFSLWGLLDFYKYTQDARIKDIYDRSLHSLEKFVPLFDTGYWSKYDFEKRICSPFYHKLHIEQLKVMYELTGSTVFSEYALKWERYERSIVNRSRAFIKKAFQKILE